MLKLLKSKWADAVLMDVSSTTASSLVRKYLAQVGLLKDGVQFAELCRLLKAVGVGVGLNVLDVKREVVPLVDDRSAFTLWLDGYYETIDGDILLEQFSSIDATTLDRLLSRASVEDLHALFELLIDGQGGGDLERHPWPRILAWTLTCPNEIRMSLVSNIEGRSSPMHRLRLWLDGYTERFDIDEYAALLVEAEQEEQFTFVRRLFKNAAEGKRQVSPSDLKVLLGYGAGRSSLGRLDPSLEIALTIVADQAHGFVMERHVGEVLMRHFAVESSTDYKVVGLFDECAGRAVAWGYDTDDNISRKAKPKELFFCEGRKAAVLDREYERSFWWCRNKPCFMPSRSCKPVEEWRGYTVVDMLSILGRSWSDEEYQLFLGGLNRLNALLARLNCRSCGHMMRPQDQSNFAFYRATKFKCVNDACAEKALVYLNRCWQSKCLSVIDSRDSKACSNGMYICSVCNGCCSSKVFERRLGAIRTVGQAVPDGLMQLVVANAGHAETQEYFCHACGGPVKVVSDDYRKTLEWLKGHCRKHPSVKDGGQRSDGGWWFKLDVPPEKYVSLKKLGFQLVKDKRFNTPLVAEPWSSDKGSVGSCMNNKCRMHRVPRYGPKAVFIE
ncbi:MAG: hypothetical protein IPN38_07345 [Flavobacteriales bacterium]|nr:hypothetical protein [Flavobacteriales bacterium]